MVWLSIEKIGEEYEENCICIRARIKDLQIQSKETEDAAERLNLQNRINALIPLLREARELGRYCKNYHKWGRRNCGQRSVRYPFERNVGFDGCLEADQRRDQRGPERTVEAEFAESDSRRIDTATANRIIDALFAEPVRKRNCKRTRP